MPEINLRKELVDWLSRRGHWVVLRQFAVVLPSAVDNETGQTYEPSRGVYDSRHFSDHLIKGDRRSVVPELEFALMGGTAVQGSDFFYLESHVPVKQDDLVLEVELQSDGKPVIPFKIRKAFKVTRAEDMRDGAGLVPGRVEFYQCRVTPVTARP